MNSRITPGSFVSSIFGDESLLGIYPKSEGKTGEKDIPRSSS